MKLFFVGGLYEASPPDTGPDPNLLRTSMQELGAQVAQAGHELVLCSPYEGSIDVEILKGVSASGCSPRIQMYFPATPDNRAAVRQLAGTLKLEVQEFVQAAMPGDDRQAQRYAWLLSQLSAMDEAQVVIAASGNPSGSANMLLHLAEARRRPILPFGHLKGAASLSLDRQTYALAARLGELKPWLHNPVPMDRISEALDRLVAPDFEAEQREPEPIRFFLSYPRDREAEADLVETLLRRRQVEVLRDDPDFDPSGDLTQEIREAIHRSDVFIALWSAQYACSPWCYDEIALALKLREAGKLKIWLLQLDDTRVIPPEARKLILQPCLSRLQLQNTVLKLFEKARTAA